MTLLYVTQKLHEQDAFTALWVRAFVARGYNVHVICQQWNEGRLRQDLGLSATEPLGFTVSSLGKEQGTSRLGQIWKFWKLIATLKYDRVFIHMAPVWGLFGAWLWIPRRTPVYTWYTHYKRKWSIWLLGLYGKRFFCATEQSLPQYAGNPKKIVTGHGIDLRYWPKRDNHTTDVHELLMVHRLSRSKRVELSLKALTQLPEYHLVIYGIEAEKDYVAELKQLVKDLQLENRVQFRGTAPAQTLPEIYTTHRLILNMASETIDKTMLEALTCGCYPITTAGNAHAIGIPAAPAEDTPEALVKAIRDYSQTLPIDGNAMYEIVRSHHSLEALVEKMDAYIGKGM